MAKIQRIFERAEDNVALLFDFIRIYIGIGLFVKAIDSIGNRQ